MNQPSMQEADKLLKNTGEMKVMSMSSCTMDRRSLSIVKCEHEAVACSSLAVGLVARDRKYTQTNTVHALDGSKVRACVR